MNTEASLESLDAQKKVDVVGFMRLTPENAKATWVAGVTTFVWGGTAAFIIGAMGLLLAGLSVISFAWEQVAFLTIGALLAVIGKLVPRWRR